ncbi:MAG: succinate CoA transferase [bacterium]
MPIRNGYRKLTAEEAAEMIPDGATVAFSGFTPAGAAKAVPRALAARANRIHAQGDPYQLRVLTGASTGDTIDELLAREKAISWRTPYQSSPALRAQINNQEVEFLDMHLSHVPQYVSFGFLGPIHFAVIEATEITPDGRVYLTTSIGASPTFLRHADKVIIEINRYHSMRTREMADILILPPPPNRNPIPIHEPLTRIGWPYATVDPAKVAGIVEHEEPDHVQGFSPPDQTSSRIAAHVVRFLLKEMRSGRIPGEFLPVQAGVGNVANAVTARLGEDPDIPPFEMYSEVFQDSLVGLMEKGKLTGASATSLTVTSGQLEHMYDNMDFFAPRIVLRPQELSNNPGIIRRLGVIAMNTAVEVDIYGNMNSTHVFGTKIINGTGGSGDFNRNSYLSIVVCPSTAREGRISTIVPMCSHVDNNEHSVQVVATEQGLADLRGLGPIERAMAIVDCCAHPAYRDYLRNYLEDCPMGHYRHDLTKCFELHRNFMEHGSMLPDMAPGE